ncbi:MAG TPA: DUF1501 domain-containing protein [Holophagaceae bacterium]|nr:DUF1501 domain-containing protein [Holophagaceae bacterium]
MQRRIFLQASASGLAFAGLGLAPRTLRAAAAAAAGQGPILVVVIQRGACDALSALPPVGEPRYYDLRPSLAIPKDEALRLDGFFGLHPALSRLKPFYDAKVLAPVMGAGSPDPTRSHFDAQDFLESGTPGVKRTEDGCLDRALAAMPGTRGPFEAVALQPTLPRILQGPVPALALGSLDDFRLPEGPAAGGFESMYAAALDRSLRGAGDEAFQAMKDLKARDPRSIAPAPGADYPGSPLGKRMQQIAQLIKADLGLRIAVTDCGGWDTHVAQGAAKGQLSARLQDFGDSLGAFLTDLSDRMDRICLVTLTEFGRTARENGTRGTDHGHGSAAFVAGGGVKGGRVLNAWKGLGDGDLNEGRDLKVAFEHRALLGEALTKHLGLRDLGTVFPGYANDPRAWAGLLRASSGSPAA